MTTTLYGVPVSAFVAKVRIALDMKGVTYQEAAPPGGYGSAEYRAIVPAGSVPGLVVDGAALHDSNAILEWLEETIPTPRLLPADPLARARARALMGFHDTRVEASARALFPLIKNDWRNAPEGVTAGVAGINAALDRLAILIDHAPFVNGEEPGYADVIFPVTIQMAELMATEMELSLTIPASIAVWRDQTAEIPAVRRSLGIARDAMEGWMAGFRA
ncbi:MAG: glutathione S-transferase N-terminal domain-containing protein [Pseudomonadota bacterium]